MAISLQLSSASSNQAQSQSPTSQPPQTPVSPNSRPSTADSSSPHSQEKTSVPTATQEKRKTNRRANTAERRATHNAVERQRRETLNGRFLVSAYSPMTTPAANAFAAQDLAALLPNLTSVRRPSKSAIVNSSIALVHSQRRQRALACLELSTLYTQFQALKAEADEWRARAGIGRVEEGERSREFMEFVREGERWAGSCGGIEEGRRRGREVEIGGEEERANRLAEAASCTGQQNLGGLRGMDDDDDLGPEEDEGMHTAMPMPTHHVVPTSQAPATNNHLAHQQHLAQVHAQAQAQIAHAQQVQAQAQAQAQQLNMRARASTFSTPQQHQPVHTGPVHHQSTPLPVQYHHVQQHQPQHVVQVPFDNGAELYNDLGLYSQAPAHQTHYTVQSQQQGGPFSNFDLGAYNVGLPMPINVKTEPSLTGASVNNWPISPLTSDSPGSSASVHSHSSPSPSIGSVGSGDGRSRAGSLSMPVPVVGGGGQGGVMGLFY